jgi:SAM-dependent methyltransferase
MNSATNHGGGAAVPSEVEGYGADDPLGIDWNYAWQQRRQKRTSSKRNVSFWNGRAASFLKGAGETEYADKLLAIMQPEPYWSVLDIGCGTGTVAVALAPHVRSITAVDFSPKMLDTLQQRCMTLGIDNITCVQGRWEDNWDELGIGLHDITLASRSMVADDFVESIRKLEGRATEKVYITNLVGDGPYDRLLFDAVGRPLDIGPDYIYNYNVLHQMGVFANVAFIQEARNRIYDDPEDAFESMLWMLDDLQPHEEIVLKQYLREHLIRQNDGWRLSYDRVVVWAVLWWKRGKRDL